MSDDTGNRPTTPYQSGDLEAAARAARDEATRKLREEAAAKAAAIREQVQREAAERDARSQAQAHQAPVTPPAPAAPPSSTAPASPAPSTPAAAPHAPDLAAPSAPAGEPPTATGGPAVGTAAVAGSAAAAAGSAPTTPPSASSGATPDDDEDSQDKAKASRNDSSMLAFFRELPVLLAVAFLLAFLLRTFVVQVFYIPSGSMIPTLEVNDRIVVEKITYLFREPQRGEVVVFEGDTPERPGNESVVTKFTRGAGQFLGLVPANARDFVKRVIGLPGDEILIEDGVVSVNGVELDEPYAVEDLRDFGPYNVPEGKLFFLGDNRPSSADSRIESALGFVDRDHVVGRAMVIVWPFEHFDGLGTPEYPPIP